MILALMSVPLFAIAKQKTSPKPVVDVAVRLAGLLKEDREKALNTPAGAEGVVQAPPETPKFNRTLYVTAADMEKMDAEILAAKSPRSNC